MDPSTAAGAANTFSSTTKTLSPTEVEVEVHVGWPSVKTRMDAQFKTIRDNAQIKGFRRGKAPPHVLKRLFGKRVEVEVMSELIERGLLEAAVQHQLAIVSGPRIEEHHLDEGTEFRFRARVEVRPTIEKVKVDDLVVERPVVEVKNEEVDAEIDRLRAEYADLRTPDPARPAREGDLAIVDYKVRVDGEEKPDLSGEDWRFIIGENRVLDEIDQALRGAEAGMQKTVEVTYPADHPRPDLRGKKVEFRIDVKEIKERLLPEPDDEFAKDVGDFATLLELRLKIREGLEANAKQREKALLNERLLDKLVDTNEVQAPRSMVQAESQRTVSELIELVKLGLPPPAMDDAFQARILARAERKVQAGLLLHALSKQENLAVSDFEFQGRLEQIAQETGKHIAKVRVDHGGERGDAIRAELLQEKILEFLRSKAKLVDAPPPSEASGATASETKPAEATTEEGPAAGEPAGEERG
jgi:trigger factor